ncbi:MAG: DUF4440 domain-containing protein [Pyrinomonadaceae bacterium]
MGYRIFATASLLLTIAVFSSAQNKHRTSPDPRYSQRQSKEIAAVRSVLEAQSLAWNRGDVEGYMNGYSRSTETVFISGDDVTRGWQTVLDRYKRKYDSREKMGTLTFSDLEIRFVGSDHAIVLGRWHLKRREDEPHGRFTLILRSTRQGWRIIHDHTSSA